MPEPAPSGQAKPPIEALVGAATGLGTWLGAAALHAWLGASVGHEPMFWVLATLPVSLGCLGWIGGARRRANDARSEADRSTTQRRLDEATTREWITRSVLQNAFDAVLILDLEGRVLDANPPAAWMFGLALDELLRQRVATLLPDHDHLDKANIVERRSAEGERLDVEWRTRARHADGSLFAVDLHIALLKQPRVQVFTIREASARMRREERLVREALEAAKDKAVLEQRRRGLVLTVLNNGLRLHVDRQLSQIAALGEIPLGAVDDLAETTHDLLASLDQLWNLMMWERSAASPTVGPVELGAVLEEVQIDVHPVARRYRNRLVPTVAPDLDEIVTDMWLLVCALRNVVLHALRRTVDGTVRVSCVREPGRGTDWVTVYVEDDGPALTSEQLEAIQAAFEVSQDPVPPPDARAGLALAQRLARALGGHVSVERRESGTAMGLRIPMEPAKVKDVPSRPVSRMDSPPPIGSRLD